MASTIRTQEIATDYPQAGVDNDTRGFRDNFSIIEANFVSSKDEIETLQNNTVKLNIANNFAGTAVIDANLDSVTQKVLQSTTFTDGPEQPQINFVNGHYQVLRFGGDKTCILSEWPLPSSAGGNNEDRLAKITLEIARASGNSNSTDVTFTAGAGGTIFLDSTNMATTTITLSDDNIVLVEFWTTNGGVTVFGRKLGTYAAA